MLEISYLRFKQDFILSHRQEYKRLSKIGGGGAHSGAPSETIYDNSVNCKDAFYQKFCEK